MRGKRWDDGSPQNKTLAAREEGIEMQKLNIIIWGHSCGRNDDARTDVGCVAG
jgi:hypothetical protein